METSECTIPRLREITRIIGEISPLTHVKEVVDIFRNDQSLLALPVADQGKFTGIVNRKTLFFKQLGRPFAMDLYGKTPILELMETAPVAMAPDLDINGALARLLATDSALDTDAFPVVANERCLGIVSVSELMMRISENQALLLETLNRLSARIREEVAKASTIQHDLLPPDHFRFGRITVGAEIRNSSEIGGDFYDYFPCREKQLGLVVADVSGHGVQSGMVTAAAKASLHTLINRGIKTPAELLRGMNNAILATARQTLLMTCLIAVIDLERGQVTLANAGHNFPYLYRKAAHSLEMLKEVAGYPLGFEEDCRYEEYSSPFAPGDSLFLYTDGIVECTDKEGKEFGYDRLESFLLGHLAFSPAVVKQKLLEAASLFTGGASFEDDITLLIAASDN